MKTHNPENERIKHRYFVYLKEAKRQSEASVDAVAKALSRFEEDSGYRNFKAFHIDQARAFKRHLAQQVSQQTGKPLSNATLYSTLKALRNFFVWLAGQPGFRSRFSYSDADYFNLSERETRIATAPRERLGPTLEQIEQVIRAMPSNSEIERRDRALLAFTTLTGMRDSAIASVKLKHLDVFEGKVEQDPREVKTKFGKNITTWFFPVGEIYRQILADWVGYLRKEKLWGLDDPVFPKTHVAQDTNRHFARDGIAREHWSSTEPIRDVFKAAFARVGLPYFNPHSFRNTLTRLGEQVCQTPQQFKAWSQNLGHEQVMTTFTSYGTVARHRQAEIMRELWNPQKPTASTSDSLGQIIEAYLANHRQNSPA